MIAAIILAAGESSRMGRLKPLLPWAGMTLLAWQVDQMRAAGAGDVVVVLGHEAETIARAMDGLPARIVVNEAYQEGRASSLRCGAGALGSAGAGTARGGRSSSDQSPIGAILILGVDQPRPASVSRRLIERWQTTAAPLVVPTFAGRRGHPVLVDRSLLDELRNVTEAGLGLRAVTERHTAETELVAIENAGFNVDLNTVADYESAYVMFERSNWQ